MRWGGEVGGRGSEGGRGALWKGKKEDLKRTCIIRRLPAALPHYAVDCWMGSDAAFICVMVGTRSGPRALRPLYRRKPSRGTVGWGGEKDRDGANAATTPCRAFQPSLIRRRLGELACLHALCFPHFVFCGDRGSHSSHPLSRKHGGFIRNAKKEEKMEQSLWDGWFSNSQHGLVTVQAEAK